MLDVMLQFALFTSNVSAKYYSIVIIGDLYESPEEQFLFKL